MSTQIDNPMGLDGFEFVEFAAPDPSALVHDFTELGFIPVAKHRSKNVTLYRQGSINFIINSEPGSEAEKFAKLHGPSACAMAFRVKDAKAAYERALKLGAESFPTQVNAGELQIPAIVGIGGSAIYFVDRYKEQTIYDVDFEPIPHADNTYGTGLTIIDHLTHNVYRGNMDKWAEFYERLFNFHEIRFFDIKGKMTGLISRALASPCGKIKIPINEATDDQSQIEEYLHEYKGEGIQHIALATNDIYETIEELRENRIQFLDVPDTYFEMIKDRVPWHQEDVQRLQKNKILLDGTKTPEGGLLLQIFTQNMLGPIFFEIIQRKGNEGFGEGNFQALFEAMERDQMRRGVLK
ncbi:MAG: 4-hydroxyphenylpyruvate dioxygenase [Proteobacteria bacterium]|nr:4-hydroxyphenylpyruvate dioxygenase [Pseudomonadota bacterium]